jgi:Gpi18-like mannosyltransferase
MERSSDRGPALRYAVLAMLVALLATAAFYARFATTTTPDFGYIGPWIDAIRSGGFAAMAGGYSNYTPPYLYLLGLAKPLYPLLGVQPTVKLIDVVFDLVGAAATAAIVSRVTGLCARAVAAGATFLVLPTVLVNGLYWGQCDVIYADCILLFVLATLRGAPLTAMALLGVAFALKFQAVFVAPYVLWLLVRRAVAPWHVLAIPVVYAVAMIPALVAGRPAGELATIYLAQSGFYHELSMHAPNGYAFITGHVPTALFRPVVLLGIAATAAAIVAFALLLRRLPDTPRVRLLVAAAAVVVMPFVLPQMHDRYFFLADVLTLAAAFVVPRLWPAAALMQLGSLLGYSGFLLDFHRGAELGAPCVLAAFVLLVRGISRARV